MTRSLGVVGTSGALALLLTAFAGAARSQGMPQAPPLTPEQEQYLEGQNKYWQEFEQWRREREAAGIARGEHDYVLWLKERAAAEALGKGRASPQAAPPAAKAAPQSLMEEIVFHPVTWAVAAGAVLLGVLGWLYPRLATTTDPTKLALSDPWVRAQLARQNPGSAPGGPAEPKPID
jgi:hypothetical protein